MRLFRSLSLVCHFLICVYSKYLVGFLLFFLKLFVVLGYFLVAFWIFVAGFLAFCSWLFGFVLVVFRLFVGGFLAFCWRFFWLFVGGFGFFLAVFWLFVGSFLAFC